MRDYMDVVKNRYDNDDFSGEGVSENIYSLLNNVGAYGYVKAISLLRDFIKCIQRSSGKQLDEISILDCGCGSGLVTRSISELLGSPKNVCGFDMSKTRLEFCKKMNPLIEYKWGDAVREFPDDFKIQKFDGVISFDMLMHIRKDDDIKKAMHNIYESCNEGGVFLWLDPNVQTHFGNYDSDGEGYSVKEMDYYASLVGFEKLKGLGIYRIANVFGRKYSTYYAATRFPVWFLELLEKILVCTQYSNNVCLYLKK